MSKKGINVGKEIRTFVYHAYFYASAHRGPPLSNEITKKTTRLAPLRHKKCRVKFHYDPPLRF